MRKMSVFVLFFILVFQVVAGADATDMRMSIAMSHRSYMFGDDITFTVEAFNPTEEDITLEFPSALQMDYTINGFQYSDDSMYRYSDNRGFAEVITTVTIPVKDSYTWEFIHTAEDFELRPGVYGLVVQIVGTGMFAKAEIYVNERIEYFPEGIVLSVDAVQDMYEPGETPEFTVTARNITESDISIMVDAKNPVRYYVLSAYDDEIRYPEVFVDPIDTITIKIDETEADDDSLGTEPVEIIVPAGEAHSWDCAILEERLLLGGTYTIYAGLNGYGNQVTCEFAIRNVLVNGTISGTVMTYAEGTRTLIPLASATVELKRYASFRTDLALFIGEEPDSLSRITITDENGAFSLGDVPVGYYYYLTVTMDGYYPYNQSFITYYEDTILQPVMKPLNIQTDNPLNYTRSKVADIEIIMGTEWSVFEQKSEFKASMSLTNTGEETVYFSFDNGYFVNWSILDKEGTVVWESVNSDSTLTDIREVDWKLELSPGETREFSYFDIVSNMLPGQLGKYEFYAELAFTGSSDERITPGDIGESIRFVVDTVFGQEIDVKVEEREYIVDLIDSLKTEVRIEMNDDAVSGEMCITEMKENHHAALNNHRFVKMIKIDADYSIRSNMNNATVKIFFEPGDYENPEDLVIAHWREHYEIDMVSSLSEGWEILETRVDLENGFVEADTGSFSYFGLFEAEKPTSVEDMTSQDMYYLGQNSPNPFNPTTTLTFSIASPSHVKLEVYSITGQKVATLVDGYMIAGVHSAVFDGRGLASGMYFYRFVADGFEKTGRMMLVK
ncbi:BsuPI-related putative proteinase inhibitor [Candidatus Latescibacterota bacterium]